MKWSNENKHSASILSPNILIVEIFWKYYYDYSFLSLSSSLPSLYHMMQNAITEDLVCIRLIARKQNQFFCPRNAIKLRNTMLKKRICSVDDFSWFLPPSYPSLSFVGIDLHHSFLCLPFLIFLCLPFTNIHSAFAFASISFALLCICLLYTSYAADEQCMV